MFREGRPPNAVISQLRSRHRADYATVPSVRTMRRWYSGNGGWGRVSGRGSTDRGP
jgi:hypothetical protein